MRSWALLAISIQSLAAQTTCENHGGYAYKIKIPRGLTAVKAPPPAPAHGFVIQLDPSTASKVFVDGTYNAMIHASVREAAEVHATYLAATLIGRVKFRTARFGCLPAVRFTLRYHDIDEILLDTIPAQAAKHLVVFEALIKSFQLARQGE
jgi:hypothetical protein